ncbi:tetratricopeptide repeat protein [Winogradskyella immobilis]|uniref:Tetratricopeptide repeat protein n=1 Tax=Winogradskyella immobilis TaxID=2816852 RepID=A0ABS8EPG0_9FLAO|nr:tetratricopeptide repeat protein [Winogradskyella immobilis]MCC1485108.1 tetratricopeptide repeat protein [Winogradskyella immobilis]MCG0017200.1 tetratricopeptide repeat protein [Winogradskyella immobilis]
MKKTVFFFFILVLIANINSAQNTKLIDSLKHELSKRKLNDSIKIFILTKLHEELMFSKPEEARQYALQELDISKKIDYKEGLARGNFHLGNYYSNRSENDSALYYYNIAKNYYLETKSTRGLIFVNHSLSTIEHINGNFDKAISTTKENIKLINISENEVNYKKRFIGAQYVLLSNIYIEKGNYNIALKHSLEAISLFSEINDLPRKADALKQIGDIEYVLGNYESSINYYNKSIKIYQDFDDKIYLASAHNSIGLSYQKLNQYENALESQKNAISLAKEVNDKSSISSALYNLGELYIEKKAFSKAKEVLIESKTISEAENLKINIVNAHESLAKVYYHENSPNQALNLLDKAITIAKAIEAIPHLKRLYKYRSKVLENQNKNKEAIFYLKASQKLEDSLFSIKKSQQIEELKTIYETEKKEAEIALQEEEIKTLNTQAKNDKLTKTLYGIGMFSFITIAGLLYFGFKQRIKKNKIKNEKQEAIYKQEIAFKKKELASQTLHLVQKNTFIQELKENLERIKKSPELFKVEFRRLVLLLKKQSAEDKDWEVFKSYFSQVHNDFDQKIKSITTDISEKEIRLASFLRMNLSTKEIASMLNVLPDSVLKSKYRLKQKLQLTKAQDLTQFLNSL